MFAEAGMANSLAFDPGFPISLHPSQLAFAYGPGVFGPSPEMRRLDAIRPSLRDPNCSGPDPVYGIAMDVGREEDLEPLKQRLLLFGAVVYAEGRLGDEPVRSQGHVHRIAPHSGWSPPEIFEIWNGSAIIYAQERAQDDPGCCVAVTARAGEQVVVPPGWAHCVINADPLKRMAFGAWCDRQYGFDYSGVRAHHGLAWFPKLTKAGTVEWEANPRYRGSGLEQRRPRLYPELGLKSSRSIYKQFLDDPETVMFVAEPGRTADVWSNFVP
jgi:glucose-6-phosphate isomerase, archaeal